MLIQRAYKTELKPNAEQQRLIERHFDVARFAYNWSLAMRRDAYEQAGVSLGWAALDKVFNGSKVGDFAWTCEFSKWAHQSAIKDNYAAFQHFFDGTAQYPRFRSRKDGKQSYRIGGSVGVRETHAWLPKIGWVRLKRHGYLPCDLKINSVTVSRRAGRYFVSIQVECHITPCENQAGVIGLDLGLKAFVVGSDGSRLEPPKFYRKALYRLKRLQRQHSRKVKGSVNRQKSRDKVARLHYRVACQRSDFLHKASRHYATRFGTVVVESLNVSGMVRNRHLALSISDAGWSEFSRQLRYKTLWHGSKLIEADPFYPSTKRCCVCGNVKPVMSLSERIYRCDCGNVRDRDDNAALNLKQYGTAGHAGTGSCEPTPVETGWPVAEAGTVEMVCNQ